MTEYQNLMREVLDTMQYTSRRMKKHNMSTLEIDAVAKKLEKEMISYGLIK